ncbi:MAG: hypothetical protein ACI8RZ_003771 [Myxococcota bacterium]|jgi:hypothetical protein
MNDNTAFVCVVVIVIAGFVVGGWLFATNHRHQATLDAARAERLEATVGPCQESYHRKGDTIVCHPLADIRNDGFSVRCVCP